MNKLNNLPKKKILSLFMTCGFPNLSQSKKIFQEMLSHQPNIIEFGLPFSDPMADGPIIQESSKIALKSKLSTKQSLNLIKSLKKYGIRKRSERRKIIGDLLEAVNMRPEYMDRYPHEFSGGQRQRIGIARALCIDPEIIVCDEAVSALDVSIQAQVLQLLMKLRKERNLTYLFITHDLSVTEYLCDRIAVMYLGRIVELCKSEDLYKNTLHPYSEALISAIPVADLDKKTKRIVLEGDVPSPVNPPSGCPFHPRCPKAKDICKTKVPELRKYTTDGNEHYASCHLINLPEIS